MDHRSGYPSEVWFRVGFPAPWESGPKCLQVYGKFDGPTALGDAQHEQRAKGGFLIQGLEWKLIERTEDEGGDTENRMAV